MVVRELVTLLGFQVQDEKLQKYERGISRVITFTKWAGLGIAALGTIFVKTAGDMEQTQMAFETILDSTKEANKLLDDIAKFAAETPFERSELIAYTKSMLGVGWAVGEIIPTLTTLGNIAAGVGKEKLPNILLAFNKMRAKGRASLEELWPIVEAGVPVLESLQKQLGLTKDQIIKMATDGKLSFETVQRAMQDVERTRFAGLMIKQSRSFLGIVSNIIDYLGILSGEIGAELIPMAKDLGLEFLNFMETNKDIIKSGIVSFFRGLATVIGYGVVILEEIINSLGGFDNISRVVGGTIRFVWKIVGGALGVLWKLRYVILVLTTAFVAYNLTMKALAFAEYIRYLLWFIKATKGAALVQGVLNTVMSLNPIGLVIAVIAALIAITVLLVKNWDKVVKFFKWAGNGMVTAFKKVLDFFLNSELGQVLLMIFAPFLAIPLQIIKHWDSIQKYFTDFVNFLSNLFSVLWTEFINKIKDIWGWVVKIVDKVKGFLGIETKPKDDTKPKGTNPKGNVPKYKQGTSFVPEDQYAFLHKGETVWPAGALKNMSKGNTVYQVNSNPTIVVPPGTPQNQVEYLRKTAKQVFQEEWQSVLRQTSGAFPSPT
jgi:tape measure domain-containing protein